MFFVAFRNTALGGNFYVWTFDTSEAMEAGVEKLTAMSHITLVGYGAATHKGDGS